MYGILSWYYDIIYNFWGGLKIIKNFNFAQNFANRVTPTNINSFNLHESYYLVLNWLEKNFCIFVAVIV